VTITLAEPKILSLESPNPAPKYYLNEGGLINPITDGDREQILLRLKDQARKSADASLAIGDAKQMIEMRFHDLFRAYNVKTVILFSSDQPQTVKPLGTELKP
jgi:hypothetical protein